MRIIAGSLKGRKLRSRVPEGTRPTSDRLRETLFNILGPRVIESMFLDGYAGTGAVGIEALSRGASEVWFVERAAEAAKGIRSNLDALGLASACRVLNTDLDRALRVCRGESVAFDIVFLDPPYEDEGLYGRNLAALGSGGLLRDGGWIVVEHSRRLEMPDSSGGLRRFRTLAEGSSALTFYDSEDS